MDKRTYLKVKIKSLAEEARIIRKETKKARNLSIKNGLALHRTGVVRTEARLTQLAYGFLRGLEYLQMEQKAHTSPDWARVRKMVAKYCTHWDWSSEMSYKEHQEEKAHILEKFDQWIEQTQVTNEIVENTT